jgi:hypothetical protein
MNVSTQVKIYFSIFIVTTLTCGYLAIISWDGPIYQKFISGAILSGIVMVILGWLWSTAVQQDNNDLLRVQAVEITKNPALLYKPKEEPNWVSCTVCGEPVDRNKHTYCPKCDKFIPLVGREQVECSYCKTINDVTDNLLYKNGTDAVFCTQCRAKLPVKKKIQAGPESGV